MRDSLGREITYARVSITDRCNLRCRYCMPAEGIVKRAHADILSFDDIERVCGCFARLGISRLKVTGGEPLVRRGAVDLIARLKRIDGIASVTVTTNGVLLAGVAAGLRQAGIDGVNVSLDTLDPDEYRELTRGGEVTDVLRGIDAAVEAGIPNVKVNCVPMAGFAETGVCRVAELARSRPVHVRFIELMPMGWGADMEPLGRNRVRDIIQTAFGPLSPVDGVQGNGPARYYALEGFTGRIGFIDTLDHGLCTRCNRLRLTAEGVLKSCLHMDTGISLRAALSGDDEELEKIISHAIMMKPIHHRFGRENGDGRGMSQIGG